LCPDGADPREAGRSEIRKAIVSIAIEVEALNVQEKVIQHEDAMERRV
jgi:hypothetical protein